MPVRPDLALAQRCIGPATPSQTSKVMRKNSSPRGGASVLGVKCEDRSTDHFHRSTASPGRQLCGMVTCGSHNGDFQRSAVPSICERVVGATDQAVPQALHESALLCLAGKCRLRGIIVRWVDALIWVRRTIA